MNPSLGVGLGLAASIAWAVANVYVQRAGRELGSLRAMWWAQLVGGLVLVPVAVLVDGAPAVPDVGDLLITGAASALGYYGMLRAFRVGPLSVIVPIVASWSIPAVAAGVVWRGEAPGPLHLLGAALIVAGSAWNGVLAGRQGDAVAPDLAHGTPAQAVGWALAGSVGFGVMATGVAQLSPQLGEIGVIPAVWATQWVLLAPLLLRAPGTLVRPDQWGSVAGMALWEAGGFVAFSLATSVAPVSLVSPPASLSTLFTVGFAATVLRERVGWARWGCIALAVVGTVILGG